MIRAARVLVVAVIAVWTCLIIPAPAAGALDIGSCKTPPTPQMPGRGFSGWIDSGPTHYNPAATSVYDTVQYPPEWSTYDLGCGGGIRDPGATLDTTIGNWLKGAATAIVALADSLHRFVSPPTFLSHLNPLLIKGSAALRRALFTPYIGLSLLLIGVGIIFAARKKQLPRAVEAIVWAVGVMTVATILWQYPVQAGSAVDRAATSAIGDINASLLGQPKAGTDPASARADLLTDTVLYRQWLAGELGSATSPIAKQYGRRLLADQTFTYAEAATMNGPDKKAAGKLVIHKLTDFAAVASAIQKADPDAYQHLQGKGGGRAGQGAVSLVAAVLVAPFMIAADVLVIVALFIVRFLVIFFPMIAVIGVFLAARLLVIAVFSRVLGGVINAVVFAVGAAVNALCVGVLLGSNTGLPAWAAILLCGIVTLILWKAFKPFTRLGAMASPRSAVAGHTDPLSGKHRRALNRAGRRQIIVNRAARGRRDDGLEPTAAPSSAPPRGAPPEAWSRPVTPPAPPTAAASYAPTVTAVPDPRRPTEADPRGAHPTPGKPAPRPLDPAPTGHTSPRETTPPRDGQAPPRVPLETPAPRIYAPGEPLPVTQQPFRADSTIEDGKTVWRIWDSESKTYRVVRQESESESEAT